MVKSSSTASQVCASLLGSLLPVVLLATSTPAAAQAYPSKPVKIMVGASPGGGTDIIARMLAEKMAGELTQPFVVENRPGASNTIAADVTAKAPADGHTLLVATNTGQAIAPHLIKLGFDPNKDLTPVALIVTVPNVLFGSSTPFVVPFWRRRRAKSDTAILPGVGLGAGGWGYTHGTWRRAPKRPHRIPEELATWV